MASCFPSRHASGKKQKVEKLVAAILKRKVQLLALDFDQTFVDIHTQGGWEDAIDGLVQHVRPCFRDLLQHAHQKGVFVCIVSFHPNSGLIRELVRKVFSKKVAEHVYVQAAPWPVARLETRDGHYSGKEYHLNRVLADILRQHEVEVKAENILLLDDDMKNVEAAARFHHRAFHVQVDKKDVDFDVLDSFERMLTIAG